MKKLIAVTLSGVLAVCALTACGGSKNADTVAETEAPTSEVTEMPEATESVESVEAAEAAEAEAETTEVQDTESEPTPTPKLQTAEEAADDQVTIQNELDSIEGLIQEGYYDDALMQAKALMTKNLTEADKELIQEYYNKLQQYIPSDLTD